MGSVLVIGAETPVVAKTVVLKLGWTASDGATDPYAITARQFAMVLEKEAPGQFKVEFYPKRALDDEKEMILYS